MQMHSHNNGGLPWHVTEDYSDMLRRVSKYNFMGLRRIWCFNSGSLAFRKRPRYEASFPLVSLYSSIAFWSLPRRQQKSTTSQDLTTAVAISIGIRFRNSSCDNIGDTWCANYNSSGPAAAFLSRSWPPSSSSFFFFSYNFDSGRIGLGLGGIWRGGYRAQHMT